MLPAKETKSVTYRFEDLELVVGGFFSDNLVKPVIKKIVCIMLKIKEGRLA